jgi:hypothetical protein
LHLIAVGDGLELGVIGSVAGTIIRYRAAAHRVRAEGSRAHCSVEFAALNIASGRSPVFFPCRFGAGTMRISWDFPRRNLVGKHPASGSNQRGVPAYCAGAEVTPPAAIE